MNENSLASNPIQSKTGTKLEHSTSALIGTMFIGRYKVIQYLSGGAFGNVYLAKDTKMLRDVALKILKPANGRNGYAQSMIDAFIQEAQLVAALTSPHTVTLHDYEKYEKNGNIYAFMVFEYLPGLDLARFIASRGALGIRTTMNIAVQILKSLAEAHSTSNASKAIIHRDIKPANIMVNLTEVDEEFVKVLDFGMSKLIEGPQTYRTENKQFTGTQGYMSPEQRNFSGELMPASDLFGVGIIMWRCLSGEPRVPSRFSKNEDIIIEDSLCVGVPALKEIIERLLRFDPARRYQRAEDVIIDIEHLRIHRRTNDHNITATNLKLALVNAEVITAGGEASPTVNVTRTEGLEVEVDMRAEFSNVSKTKTKDSNLIYILGGMILFLVGVIVIGKMLPQDPKIEKTPEVLLDLNAKKSPKITEGSQIEESVKKVEPEEIISSTQLSPTKSTKKKRSSKKLLKSIRGANLEVSESKKREKIERKVVEKNQVLKPAKPKNEETEKKTDTERGLRSLDEYGL